MVDPQDSTHSSVNRGIWIVGAAVVLMVAVNALPNKKELIRNGEANALTAHGKA